MNIKLKTGFLILLSFSSPILASAKNASPYINCPNYLDCAKAYAQQEIQDLKRISEENPYASACKKDLNSFRQKYDEDFLAHYDELKAMDLEVQKHFDHLKSKLTALFKNFNVELLPNQAHPEGITLTFSQLLRYFHDYNELNKNGNFEQRKQLAQSRHDASKSFSGFTMEAAADALDQALIQANASLKENSSPLLIEASHDFGNYDVVIKNTITTSTQSFPLVISLIENQDPALIFSEKNKWEVITEHYSSDHYKIDGKERFLALQDQLRNHDCRHNNWVVFDPDSTTDVNHLPYIPQLVGSIHGDEE